MFVSGLHVGSVETDTWLPVQQDLHKPKGAGVGSTLCFTELRHMEASTPSYALASRSWFCLWCGKISLVRVGN